MNMEGKRCWIASSASCARCSAKKGLNRMSAICAPPCAMVRKRRGEIVRRLVERECAKFQMQRLCRALCGVELVRHMHVRKDRQAGSFGEGMRQQFDPLCGQFRLPVEQSS